MELLLLHPRLNGLVLLERSRQVGQLGIAGIRYIRTNHGIVEAAVDRLEAVVLLVLGDLVVLLVDDDPVVYRVL